MNDPAGPLGATLASAGRILFLTASAPVVGATLLLAVACVTGARWRALTPLAVPASWLLPAGALLGLTQLTVAAPNHLTFWMAWWAVGLRALIAGTAVAFASMRLRANAGPGLAAATLAIYALVATPLASDWMLGQAPGHPASAIGMMHFTETVAGASAAALVAGLGPVRFLKDMAKLMIAAALGLGYLAYMNYLIVWYGNLPSHVGFYIERSTAPMASLVWAALTLGVAVPILLLSLVGEDRGRRLAGMSTLVGLFLFNAWWVSGGLAAPIVAAVLALLIVAVGPRLWRRGGVHV